MLATATSNQLLVLSMWHKLSTLAQSLKNSNKELSLNRAIIVLAIPQPWVFTTLALDLCQAFYRQSGVVSIFMALMSTRSTRLRGESTCQPDNRS